MKRDERIDTGRAFRLLWRFLVKQKSRILAGVFATIMIGLMELLTGAFLKFLTNTVTKIEGLNSGGEELKIPVKLNLDLDLIGEKIRIIDRTLSGPEQIFRGILVISVTFFILYLFQALFQYAREVYMNLAIEKVLQDFKSKIFAAVMGAPVKFFNTNSTGDVISRITYDVAVLTDTINILVEISRTFIYMLMFIPAMFLINTRFALYTVIFFPVSFILIRIVARIIKRSSRDVSDNVGDYTAFLEERINRLRLIKTSRAERAEQASFDQLVEKNYRFRRRLILQRFFLKPSNELLGILVLAILFVFFSSHLLAGQSNVGDVAFFLYLVKTSFKPVKKVAQAVGDLNMALISTGKIERLFGEEQERTGGSHTLGGAPVTEILISNAKFGYNGRAVIDGLSLEMKRGDRIVITGESGAGKTTLCSLLVLLNEPGPGQVMLNGIDITSLPPAEVRSAIALVSGEMPLIPGTIRENVLYGTGAGDDDLEQFRHFLPGKVWTEPGLTINGSEGGLTSGEARKIAFARALLSKPSVLLLDEAFGFMDEEDIRKALNLIPAGIITLFVSRSTIVMDFSDRVYRLRGGVLA